MNKTIGILAHVDAGKTTFAEQILYHTKSIRTRGRVDHGNTLLDSHSIEKDRGITVFSDQGIFQYNDSTYYLIDTPGHIDFSPEMERNIKIMDYAVVIISAVEGVQSHTETVWNLLRKYEIPTFIFINKIDRVGADINVVLEDIKRSLTEEVCYITDSFSNGEFEEELIEFIAERDEELLKKYFDNNFDKDLWLKSMKNMIKENKIFPCVSGSALQDIGIEKFIEKLDCLTFTEYSDKDEFSGRIYKVRYDNDGNRITYIKALSGSLKVKKEINYIYQEENFLEKVNEIRVYNGCKYKKADRINAGELFSVVGLSNAVAGQGVGALKEKTNFQMIPILRSKVIFDKDLNIREVLKYFKILEAEDPVLNVVYKEELKEISINIMGIIQLEVIKQLVEERFNITVDFGPCEILYKETIESECIGYGHFEPLGHYAEVHLKLEPTDRNSGITFENNCHTDNLTLGNQNLVRTHIFEKEHNGILTGSPVTDIKITLLTGAAHNKHTSGGDFREATLRALRQGLEKTNNILLEPFYNFKIEVELDYLGRVLSDVQKLHGFFQPPETILDKAIIKGEVPVATFMNYPIEFISFTKGKGKINLNFKGYDICHNPEEVIKNLGYNKNADIKYTSSSIFCSKGQGFVVKGKDAKDYMHCV
ncbi:MAG: GTP-binding protein [Clostridiaceae bacterium]